MSHELLLMRHGKADPEFDGEDFRRPLTDRGKRAAQRIGAWLARERLAPDHVVASPAARARVTAEKACKVMGIGAQQVHTDERLYLADEITLKAVLAEVPSNARRVMLVGHNPGLERLLVDLSATQLQRNHKGRLLPTATLARLQLADGWRDLAAGSASVLNLQYPADLPEKFPFPGPDGEPTRDRPAYYYTQSAVIPYRVTAGQVEILIIRSSRNKHWVVPKGIADVGLSMRESAAKEAWEEAGVEGAVGDESLGSYQCTKWGASCTVTVYPMAVSREIGDDEWQERHRGRRWVSPDLAAGLLRQPELRPMVERLARRLAVTD